MYKLVLNSDGIRRDDGAWIPNNPLNKDWVAYQQWLEQGNTPSPADTPEESSGMDPPMKQLADRLIEKGVLTPEDVADLTLYQGAESA